MTRKLALALALTFLALQPLRADEARDLYERGAYAEAARLYEERLTSKRDVATLAAAGNCWAQLGNLDRARERYEEARRLEPASVDLARNLGRVLYRAGRYREAASVLARGQGDMTDTTELRLYSSALALADDPEGAVLALERAVLVAPGDARIRVELGTAYARAGRAAQAARTLRAAIAADASLLDAWVPLGHALAASSERDEAIVALEVASRLGSADRASLGLLADLELDAGLAGAAADAYETLVARENVRDPGDEERLGLARLRSGEPARALVVLDAALAREPGRPLARFARGEALLALGRGEEAHVVLEALARDPRAGELGRAARARLDEWK